MALIKSVRGFTPEIGGELFFGGQCGCHWRRQDGTGLQHLVQHRAAG